MPSPSSSASHMDSEFSLTVMLMSTSSETAIFDNEVEAEGASVGRTLARGPGRQLTSSYRHTDDDSDWCKLCYEITGSKK